jgi:hypothetical protein
VCSYDDTAPTRVDVASSGFSCRKLFGIGLRLRSADKQHQIFSPAGMVGFQPLTPSAPVQTASSSAPSKAPAASASSLDSAKTVPRKKPSGFQPLTLSFSAPKSVQNAPSKTCAAAAASCANDCSARATPPSLPKKFSGLHPAAAPSTTPQQNCHLPRGSLPSGSRPPPSSGPLLGGAQVVQNPLKRKIDPPVVAEKVKRLAIPSFSLESSTPSSPSSQETVECKGDNVTLGELAFDVAGAFLPWPPCP